MCAYKPVPEGHELAGSARPCGKLLVVLLCHSGSDLYNVQQSCQSSLLPGYQLLHPCSEEA